MYTAANTYRDLADSGCQIAVLPVGSLEQHGPHAPLATDSIIAEAVSRGVAERLDAYLLPVMPFGVSKEHLGFAGTVSLEPWTLSAVVKEIGLSLIRAGFRWFVVISGHASNLIIQTTVREINAAQESGIAMLLYPWEPVLDRLGDICPDSDVSFHAGCDETSLVMYLYPERVKDNREDFVPDPALPEKFFDYLSLKDMSPSGVWGRPSLASAEKGQQILDLMIDGITAQVQQTIKTITDIKEGHR